MSLAVREVSVAKGYDPRDFALVASGGAGPLHVCAIARELYIPTVIVPLFPSHFSALGMLLADERHDFTRTVYSDLASVDFAKLVAVHDEMVQGRQGQPAPHQERERTRSISICATWARSSRLQVPVTLEQLKKRRPQGDPHRVRRALRASLRAPFAGRAGRDGQHPARRHRQAAEAELPEPRSGRSAPRRPASAQVYFTVGQQAAAPPRSIAASDSARAREIAGPALIQEHGTTTVLFEHDRAGWRDSGELIITIGAARMKLDPVTLEVIRNALPAVANEMAADLQRTSYNMMIYEVRDYCTALLNTKGELISQNVGGVSHFVADLGVLITDGMERYGADGFKPGDVIITNHQAVAGQHLNNVVIYMPYFYKGELLMFADGARALDRRRRHLDRLRRRRDRRRPLARRAAARPAQDLRGGQARRDALPRHQGQHPLPGILARRHEIADGGLPPRRRGGSTSCSTNTAATRCSRRSTRSSTRPSSKCRNVVAQLPDGVYEASASIDDDGVHQGRSGADPRQGHGQAAAT